MGFAIVFVGLWTGLLVFYILYLAAINIYAHWNELTLNAKVITAPIVAVMLAVDCFFQQTLFIAIFLDLSQEWLVTQRLQRYRNMPSGWRLELATWICTNMLNPFDPSRKHC